MSEKENYLEVRIYPEAELSEDEKLAIFSGKVPARYGIYDKIFETVSFNGGLKCAEFVRNAVSEVPRLLSDMDSASVRGNLGAGMVRRLSFKEFLGSGDATHD